MSEEDGFTWAPIDGTAKDGSTRLVRHGPLLMRAFWTGSMWAYSRPRDAAGRPIGVIEQVDSDPTEYALEPRP